jgi:hypothetical protein
MRAKSESRGQRSEIRGQKTGLASRFPPFHHSTIPSIPSSPGSALLIVLGFLSFMIVSGVSFAIYMRTERQASSNYRHAVSARHLLNAGFARAVEEVDAELRIKDGQKLKSGKFPEWSGRVLPSAVARNSDNTLLNATENQALDARVLSLEGLSYLPPLLVNDVRRYAVRQSSETGANSYRGAKWRTLDGPVPGRYAYVCVNVSDMLDVNQCRAQVRDSTTNRVTLGHLFADDEQRKAFDPAAQNDIHYFSLQDFYTARYKRDNSALSSPYHHYLNSSTPDMTSFNNTDLLDQPFIADSIAKAEPVFEDACNIWQGQLLTGAVNGNPTPDFNALPELSGRFLTAWNKVKQEAGMTGIDQADDQIFACMLKDYLDTDNVPTLLNVPCVEMVPMISQIVFDPDWWKYKVSSEERPVEGASPPRQVTVYRVQFLEGMLPLEVELAWPFKYARYRSPQPAFHLSVEAYLVIHKEDAPKTTMDFMNKSACIPLQSNIPSQPEFWKDVTAENDAYIGVTVSLTAENAAGVTFDVIDSEGTLKDGFTQEFSVSLIIASVRVMDGANVVDCVPCNLPFRPGTPLYENSSFSSNPKLFFKTDALKATDLAGAGVNPKAYSFITTWTGLETPDPRFNHHPANWIKSSDTVNNYRGRNASTAALLGVDGRDADIFMSVSDAGYMQSPGELGFLVRPYTTMDQDNREGRNFSTATDAAEADAMFRTVRLYDHGGKARDNIYRYFYAEKEDGTLTGARVNPLSDIDEVLEAAIWDTPLDYWIASSNCTLTAEQKINDKLTFTRSLRHFNTIDRNNDAWREFVDGNWSGSGTVPNKGWANLLKKGLDTSEVNLYWNKTVSEYYGDDDFKWYDPNLARTAIFNTTVPNPLHEVDRKMLYSFSLDSFSDRQQLFLYFIRAEVTVPTFGGGAESVQQSVAGGRAVALVWRDPYPRGYKRTTGAVGPYATKSGTEAWYPYDNNKHNNPWEKYSGQTQTPQRWWGWHDTRVLFFKQLEN